MPEVTTQVVVDSIRLTDNLSIVIVEEYRRRIGDKTLGRTLGRIIQAFHASGGQLGPATNPPAGQGAGTNAALSPLAVTTNPQQVG